MVVASLACEQKSETEAKRMGGDTCLDVPVEWQLDWGTIRMY